MVTGASAVYMILTRGRVRGETQVTSVSASVTQDPDMARDSPEPVTTLRRKKAPGAKENKRVTRKDVKKSEVIEDHDEANLPSDIQNELTKKLENLLERDRLGVS